MDTDPQDPAAQKEQELLNELNELKASRSLILSGGQSSSMEGFSKANVSIDYIDKRIRQINRSLQRLKYGGRIIGVIVQDATPSGSLPMPITGV